ncbi:peptidase family m13 protein [Cystoisospora suis]|uniref:Peptidase family m13 protein n=1 Tax=Cystoisospora suis TaxID=483139 RepID=A0A2C6L6P9_9APIC|nr:peptidase family m13 protein [Cystoisospora suis]
MHSTRLVRGVGDNSRLAISAGGCWSRILAVCYVAQLNQLASSYKSLFAFVSCRSANLSVPNASACLGKKTALSVWKVAIAKNFVLLALLSRSPNLPKCIESSHRSVPLFRCYSHIGHTSHFGLASASSIASGTTMRDQRALTVGETFLCCYLLLLFLVLRTSGCADHSSVDDFESRRSLQRRRLEVDPWVEADHPAPFPDEHDDHRIKTNRPPPERSPPAFDRLDEIFLSTTSNGVSGQVNARGEAAVRAGSPSHEESQLRWWPWASSGFGPTSWNARGMRLGKPSHENLDPSVHCIDSDHCARVAEMIKNDMNPAADPCSDTEEYYCGGWKSRTTLPADESAWTLSFDTLARDTREYLKERLEVTSCTDMETHLRRQTETGNTTLAEGPEFDEWDTLATCMYEACMDEEAIDARGATPLTARMFDADESGAAPLDFLVDRDFVHEAAAFKNSTERDAVVVERLQGVFQRLKDILFWSAYVGPNELHPDQGQTLSIGSLKLGLSYHFYSEDHLDYQEYYKQHIANILEIFESHLSQTHQSLMDRGRERNPNLARSYSERAQRIFDFEKDHLRTLVLSPEESRKVTQYTHEITYGELTASTESLNVAALLHMYLDLLPRSGSKISGISFAADGTAVIDDGLVLLIHEKDYFRKLEKVLNEADWAMLHDYVLYKVVRSDASLLSKDFRDEIKRYSKQVTKAEPLPRWRTCLAAVPQWVLSRQYVLAKFDRRKKETVQQMVRGIRIAFGNLLREYTWMDKATRDEALVKLAGMEEKIGFPDWLLDDYEKYFTKYYGDKYAALRHAHSHFDIQWHLGLETIRSQLSEFGQPVDRQEWAMKPHSVNAYFSPSQNEIAFMAAVLQEPSLFVADPNGWRGEQVVMKALSYGAIAGVIAHEVTHGFDDMGKEYDAEGRLRNWWTPESEEGFREQSSCIREQYSGYSVLVEKDETNREGKKTQVTVRVRGDLTLGENIADNGGVQLAWEALKLELSPKELAARPLLGYGVTLTTAQLFTFSWGHFWCEVALDSHIRRQVETDPHSPARFRIQGPLANFAPFADLQGCPANSTMNPSRKCRVW